MARLPRLVIAGLPHLVSQRAQHAQVMVRDDADRLALLRLLQDAARQHRVAVHAYAILDGRLDLVVTPEEAPGLSLMMQAVARRHAAAFNRRHARVGALWEGRFRTAVIEPTVWLLQCMVHVEQLAVTVEPWSSRRHHCGLAVDPLVTDPTAYWSLGNTPFDREATYRLRLEQALTSMERDSIQAALRGGWVLGSAEFATLVGKETDRPASPRKRGRPPRGSSK